MLIYFLHIPKTAGTSVRSWLSDRFKRNEICPAEIWDDLVQLGRNDLQAFQLFSGQFGVDLADFIEREVATITIFRDPVLRTKSHYLHVMRSPDHPYHQRVSRQSQSYEDFLWNRENWTMIENFQERWLVQSPINFRLYFNRLDASDAKVNRLAVAAEETRYLFDQEYVLDKALEALGTLAIAGVTDDLETFASRVTQRFHLSTGPNNLSIPYENVAPLSDEDIALSGKSLELIRRLTTIDQRLYDMTKQLNLKPLQLTARAE
jgi:hypothetical protein